MLQRIDEPRDKRLPEAHVYNDMFVEKVIQNL